MSRRWSLVRPAEVIAFSVCLLALGACGGSSKPHAASTTTTSPAPTTSTKPPAVSTTSVVPSSSSAVTTTTVCAGGGSTGALSTPPSQQNALLTAVAVAGAGCQDRVTFSFTVKGGAGPNCTVAYKPGPFTQDASGAPVAVAGTAFLSVRCSPASGFDFETGAKTYTGPKRIEATGTRFAREVVQTGDNEGVLNWVVGLGAQRPFSIATLRSPSQQLVILIS